MVRGKASKTGHSPEQEALLGVMVIAQSTGGIGRLYRHTSIPGLTLTRHHSLGRQGVPSPRTSGRLVVMLWRRESSFFFRLSRQAGGRRRWGMHPYTGLESEDKQPCNLTLRDCEEGGDGVEGARGGRPLAKALGNRAHYLLHQE